MLRSIAEIFAKLWIKCVNLGIWLCFSTIYIKDKEQFKISGVISASFVDLSQDFFWRQSTLLTYFWKKSLFMEKLDSTCGFPCDIISTSQTTFSKSRVTLESWIHQKNSSTPSSLMVVFWPFPKNQNCWSTDWKNQSIIIEHLHE